MKYTTTTLMIVIAASLVGAPIAYAEDAPADAPSPETLKLARENGIKAEVRKGVTVYCWEDADIGSHFKTKKCVNQDRLAELIQQRQAQRDQLTRGGGSNGSTR